MGYLDDEISVHNGEPIEVYEFTGPNGEYLYTSYHDTVVYNTKTYLPIAMQREDAQGGPQGDTPELRIEVPASLDLVRDYAFQVAPESLLLSIHRLHTPSGAGIVYWRGEVGAIMVRGRRATIIVPSTLAGALASAVPSVYYQESCNHVLYDARCALLASSFRVVTTISSVVDEVTINVASVGGAGVDDFRAGEIIITATSERRLILRQSGTLLTINYPFRLVSVTDAVEIFKGCDHSVATCKAKFNNVINFGGHPLIPIRNLFETGVG